jgi:hypothetical protein
MDMDQPTPPKPLTFQGDLANLPAALQPLTAKPNWVMWRWESVKIDRDGKPVWTKVPYHPNAWKVSSTDSSTWRSYEACVAAFGRGSFDGIGFCLLGSDIAAFDVDKCRDPVSGELKLQARNLLQRCGSYAEITPSGTGIRIIGLSNGNNPRHKKYPVGDGVSVEIYRQAARYMTITGRPVDDYNQPLVNIDDVIDEVYEECEAHRVGGGETGNGASFAATDEFENIEPDDTRLAGLNAKWIELGHDGTGIAEKYDGDRSRAVMAFTAECVRAGIADEIIASCLMRWRIGEHIRDQSNVVRALNRTIDKAKQFVENSKLFEMNEKHAVLPIGGKTRVATWGEDPEFPGHQTIIRFATFFDFRALHDKYRHTILVEGHAKEVPLGSWWIGHPHRRQYDNGLRFMPQRDDDVVNGTLNLWRGFAVAARKPEGKSGASGCKLFLDHGLKIICNGSEEHYDYLIKREAFIAQKRTRSEIAVGLQTETEGTGKGFWCRGLNHLYGNHAMEVQNSTHVIGKHNTHLETLLKLTADEALFAPDPHHRNALYNIITEDTITIEPKFVDAYSARNYNNIDVISNASHFVPVSGSARRFFIPTVSSDRANDHAYFGKIRAELHDGGYEALLYHLLHEIDLRDFNVRAVPKTAALAEQAAYSRKGVDLLVEIACHDAVVPCQNGSRAGVSLCPDVERSYQPVRHGFDWYIDHHPDHDLSRLGSLKVKRRLAKEWNCLTGSAAREYVDGVQKHVVRWPALAELRAKFEAKYGKQQWTHPGITEWLGTDAAQDPDDVPF